MQTLPIIPVETLAAARRAATPRNDNPGIVPPWLATEPTPNPGKNPGIVPPWLLTPRPVQPTNPTGFDRTPVLV